MSTRVHATEAVVRHHLEAFVAQQGVDAIVGDYDDDALFLTETRVYRGKGEIRGFFRDFLAALPAGAVERFTLRCLQVERDVAYITWSVDGDIALGTDTFVVDGGKIVSQTFAMCAVAGRGTV